MGNPPESDASKGAGPGGVVLVAAIGICVLAPPEVHGVGLAALAILVALAVAISSPSTAASVASRWIWVALPVVLVAIRIAIAPGEAVEPAATLLLAALAGIAASGVTATPELLARPFAVAVVFVGVRALYESLWGLASWASSVRATAPVGESAAILNRLEQGRPYAGFLTPAALGCLLAMTVPPVAAWALGKKGAARALGLGAASLGGAGLIATRSMTAMGALAAALALAALRGRVAPRALAGVGLAIGLAVAGAGLARPDAVFDPARADSPWSLRAGNVRIALAIARDHPLAGVGPGGYAEAFPQYRRPGDNESRHAHDLPAELMAEWGIPGGLLLSALFYGLFLGPVVRFRGETLTFASGLTIGLAAFALHNLVDFTSFLPSLLVVAAVSRGLLAPAPLREPSRGAARWAWVALAVACACIGAASGVAREALFDARQAAAAADHTGALDAAIRAGRIAPWDADPPQIAAEARMAAGGAAPQAALDEAEQAVVRAPERAAARWTRSRARAAAGDAAGAYADLAEAARLYPVRAEYQTQRDGLAAAIRRAVEAAPR